MSHPYTRRFVLPAPPDADNDTTEGYELGDVVHVTGGSVYDCRDATIGAAVWEERTGGGASDWGDIGGTLADQADLQAALDAKLDDSQLEDTIANGVTTKAPSQNAVFDALALKEDVANKDTDTTLAANSDTKYPSQKAIKAYVDAAVTGLLDFKGATNCSANPNYPAALKGDAYVVSVAGKIGGASGKSVDVGDVYVASADNAGGTEASVGTSWFVLEHNLQGALLAANNLSDLDSAATARSNLGLGALAVFSSLGLLDLNDVNDADLADGTFPMWVTDDAEFQFYPKSLLATANHQHWNDAEGNPAAIGTAADGTSDYAARRDHVHAITNGSAVLGSAFNITGTAGTYQDTGLSVTLPDAGTYKITANVRGHLRGNAGTTWWIHCELFNSTDAAAVANSERMVVLTNVNTLLFQSTTPLDINITVAASKVIKLYAARNGAGGPSWTTSNIESDANGRTNLSYEKIG